MSVKKMGVAQATAIAATNAVIKHLKLGLFMSEFNSISQYSLRFCKLASNAQVQLGGRTDVGTWILTFNTVIYKQDRNGSFPIEKVLVSIHEPSLGMKKGTVPNYLYFECTFGSDIIVAKMEHSPLEDIVSKPKHVSDIDDSPDAHATRYPPQ